MRSTRDAPANLGAIYLLTSGAVAIVVVLKASRGRQGLMADRYGWQIFRWGGGWSPADANESHARRRTLDGRHPPRCDRAR